MLLLLLLIQCYDAVLCCSQSTCFLRCLHRTVTMKLECWKTPRKVSVDKDWVILCITWEVEGIRQRGRPKMTRWDCVKNDVEKLGLSQKDAQSRNKWRRRIKGHPAKPGSPGKLTFKRSVCILFNCLLVLSLALHNIVEQSVIDDGINHWRSHLHACIRDTGGHYEHSPWHKLAKTLLIARNEVKICS